MVTADAIAVAIPAAAAPATTASATQATDKATAPLAIAAAAIAASASLAAETAPAAPAADATEAAATVTQPAIANAAQADGGAKTGAQGGVGQAVSAQATSADPSIATGIAQAASVVAATPAATKAAAQLKNPDLARKGATTAVEQAGTTDTAAPATPAADTIVPAVTAPTEAAGKPKSENGIADAVKADASGNSITPPAANAQAHAHLAAPDIGQTPVNSSGNGLPAAGAIQTQQPAASATTPAAAAQLTATAAASAPVPVSGLAMEIAASAKSGKTRFEIRLDPAELGRIDVRIDIDRHGQMTSHLTVERPETLSMLRQDANQLQRALDNAGLSTGNGGLQFSLRDQSSQGQNDGNQSNPNAHRLVVSEEDSVPAIVAGRNYGRMLGSSGGVDIRSLREIAMAVDATMPTTVVSAAGTGTASSNKTASEKTTGIADNFQTFLTLLTTQLQHQNPMDPLDTNQFTQQLVQFAGIEQQLRSNEQLKALVEIEKSAQATQALVYVGNTVAVDGSKAQFDKSATWNFQSDKDTSATITITNSTGQTAYSGSYTLKQGSSSFVWDGKGNDGVQWPAGTYTLTATGKDSSGNNVAISTEVQGIVDSVDLSASPPLLSIGGQSYTTDKIKRVVRPSTSS